MAAIVTANETLTKGGLAVLSRSFNADDQGQVVYKAKYCCLSAFSRSNAAKFKVGAPPPSAIPLAMSALRLYRTPTLTDVAVVTENGLTYFDATYNSETVGEFVITETETLTEFSASRTLGDDIFTISFKYFSQTVEVSAANTYVEARAAEAGAPFDIRGGGVSYRKETQISRSKTRSSRGGFTYNTRSVGLYVAA